MKMTQLTTNTNQKNLLFSKPVPILTTCKLYRQSFLLFSHCGRTFFITVKHKSIDFYLSRYLRIVPIMLIHHLELDFLQIQQIQKHNLPLESKQDGLLLLSQWTRNMTREKRTSWEMPGVSIQRMSHGNTYCKWNNTLKWTRSLTRVKASCLLQQPSKNRVLQLCTLRVLSFIPRQTFDSSKPLFLAETSLKTNWRQKSLFRCKSFAGDFAMHRFNSDNPVPL